MTATIGELCMGYGGLGMGLSLALGGDTRVAWAVEYDKHPSAIIAHRYPGVRNYGDVKTAPWADMEAVDWLTAGYPCQPFSHAGLRKGADDPRHLWPGVAHAIGVLRPRGVLLENVRGHVSLGLADVLADLSGLGYDATWGVVRAADAGAPHGRARVFILAAHSDDRGSRLRRAGSDWRGEPVDVVRHLAAADAPGVGRREGRTQPARIVGRPDAAERGPATADADLRRRSRGTEQHSDAAPHPADGDTRRGHTDRHSGPVSWGAYAPAIGRWERVTARPAPRPTEPGRNGQRLSPRFVEFLMGLPDGWVTDVPGLPRNAMLKALGNGVVPQQAALAVRLLTAQAQAAA